MGPWPILALVLSNASGQEAALPGDALRQARLTEACVRENPFAGALRSGPDAHKRRDLWDQACIGQVEPCSAAGVAEREAESVPRCRFCSEGGSPPSCPPNMTCPPDYSAMVCEPPPEPIRLPPPPRLTPLLMRSTRNCIGALIRDGMETWPQGDQRQQICAASSAAIFQRNYPRSPRSCAETPLRNADHYLFTYCEMESNGFTRGFPMTFCLITAGYSGAKAALGPLRDALSSGDQPTSPPSWDEVYWGCRGIRDQQDGVVPAPR